MLSNDIFRLTIDCGIVLLFLIAAIFMLDQLGLLTWIWWLNRHKRTDQDSSARRYWDVH